MTRDNKRIFKDLINEGKSPVKILTFLLDCEGYTKSRVAKEAGVDPSTVNKTLSGRRPSLPTKRTISYILGFDPWE